MAETAHLIPRKQESLDPTNCIKIKSIKSIAETPGLTKIPASYNFQNEQAKVVLDQHNVIQEPETIILPVIDYSLLVSGSPQQRSNAIYDLAKACQDWGFFLVINHGVEERLMKSIIEVCERFLNLSDEEKEEYQSGKHVLDPIRCGTSFNTCVEKIFFWRDFVKVFVHPVFHSPATPPRFSEVSKEYCEKMREITRELLRGISESLGLEANAIEKELNLKEGLQILVANSYPPCPQPELAMGLPPHSDHGLLTLLLQNGLDGLQVYHDGMWVNVHTLPNSFLVNTGDHLEIWSNGKYKSVLHRAVVNNKATRISIALPQGPSRDSIVEPSPKLLENENTPPKYKGIKYEEYLLLQQSNILDRKSCLDPVRLII